MKEEQARRAASRARAAAYYRTRPRPNVLAGLFDKQRQVIQHEARRKAAVTSRRAGKTHLVARYLIEILDKRDGALAVYIALTRKVARRLIWAELKRINKRLNLGLKFDNGDLEITAPNGSQIWLMGADKTDEIEKLRGFAFDLVVCDEAASFGAHFDALIEEVIEPALDDYDGTLLLTGTPGAACAGYFHDATTGKAPGWIVFHWTQQDNPQFPRWAGRPNWRELARAWLAQVRTRKKWSESHPAYCREYQGKWVQDGTSLVYRYDTESQDFDELPADIDPAEWRHLIGVDLGFDDAFALVVLAYHPDRPDVWAIDEYRESELRPSQWAEVIQRYREAYDPDRIVVDHGGLGKAICRDFQIKHGIPVTAAKKSDKAAFVRQFNADAEQRKIRIRKGSLLASEMGILQWKRTAGGGEDRRIEDPRFLNHLCDSVLYAWRESLHWTHRPKGVASTPLEKEEAEIIESFENEINMEAEF